jgi:parallel beta-helix repeat protein
MKNNSIHNNVIAVYIWHEANNNQIKYNGIYFNSIGLNIADSNYNNISNNNIFNNTYNGKCIGLIYSSNNTISRNNIIGTCYDGIELIYSPYNSIIQNNISNHLFHGIHLISSPYTTIKDNILNRNTIRIYQGELYIYSEIFQNLSVFLEYWNTHTIENNTISGKKIIYYKNSDDVDIPKDFGELIFANCSNITIENSDITNVDCGIQIGFSIDIQIINNNISNISRTGMSIAFSSNVLIKNNNITDFNNRFGLWGAGIDLFYLKGEIKIIGNRVIKTGVSIWIVGTNNTLISENTIKKSLPAFYQELWGSINLLFSSNSSIIKNDISDNEGGIGIYLYVSNNIIIQSNDINNNSQNGVILYLSINNIITNNNITGNSEFGIYLILSLNNIIKQNNFIGNNYSAFFRSPYPNLWFDNYWDDWKKAIPRPINGELKFERLDNKIIPWIQFDWKPATEPYDLGGIDE